MNLPVLDLSTVEMLIDATYQALLIWFLIFSPLRSMRKAQRERDRREAEFRKAVLERLDEQNDLLASMFASGEEGQ
jgi:hypothetical protein